MKTAAKGHPFARAGAPARRFLSALLALTMLLGLVPLWALPARAEGSEPPKTVDYQPKTPEVAILNAFTGSDQGFYSRKLLGNTDGNESDRAAYWQYNAVTLFKRQTTGQYAQYSTRATGEETWDFSLTDKDRPTPVLKSLIEVPQNLEVSASATFYNRPHTHSNFQLKTFKNWEVQITSFESMSVGIAGCYSAPIGGNKDTSRQKPRIGNYGDVGGGYKTLTYYNNDYCRLHFYPSTHEWYDFEQRKCTCGGTWAENVLVTFRDTRAPQLTDVEYSTDGTSYAHRFRGTSVGKGSTVYIKLTFDEPIRFADGTNAHGDLYLALQTDGENGVQHKAYLTQLKDDYLVFAYTVPTEQETDAQITTIGMGSLFAADAALPLVQVGRNGSFEISASDRSGEGFTTSRCYITDLAGNPLQEKTILEANLTLDSGAPYVKTVDFHLSTNNADVKEALGKADKGPGTPAYDEKTYTDASDTHLGVGDSFYLIVSMNERLQGIGMDQNAAGRYSIDWQHAVFTTNLKDKNGNAVEIRSAYYYSFYDYDREPTQFITDRITIGEGWKLASGDKIMVIAMRFEKKEGAGGTLGTVADLAGNELNMDNVTISSSANGNPPYLDAAAPTVAELENSYAEEGAGFRYGFTLSDSGSRYEGIYGSFILNNGGDRKAYEYEWAVKADASSTVAENEWKPGIAGGAQQFTQTGTVYIHIRPKAGETYVDFSNCTITVKARDLAGNESDVTLPPAGSLGWYIDNLAPTAAAGAVTTRLKDDGTGNGIITVEVALSDGRGISQWWYAWTDSADTPPENWQEGALAATAADGAVVTAASDVAAKTLFSKYLWVQAEDNVAGETKNISAPLCLGRYSYDLRDAEYELSYSRSITTYAGLSAPSMGDGDRLFFLVPAEAGSVYYAVYEMVSSGDYNIFGQPIAVDATTSAGWKFYQLREENGNYTLTPDEAKRAENTLISLRPGATASGLSFYSGDLAVTVLAGKNAAYTKDAAGVITLGDDSNKFGADTVNLRVAGYTTDIFGAITLTCEGNLGQASHQSYWTTSAGYTQRTTLAGLRFTITIGGDNRGWKYENVDWQHSYIRLQSWADAGVYYDVPIGPFQTPEGQPNGVATQTVTVPEGGYQSGIYTVTFHLEVKGGRTDFGAWLPDAKAPDTEAWIVVDTKQPNSNFSLSSLIYAPQAQYDYLRKAYGLDQSYGDNAQLELVTDGGSMIYLPISKAEPTNQAYPRIATAPEYYITITSPGEENWTNVGPAGTPYYAGRYSVQIWNTADADHRVELTTYTDHTEVRTGLNSNPANGLSFVFKPGALTGTQIYLIPDQVNIIAIQKVYENGRRSEIKYYQIKPVNEAVEGSISIDRSADQLVFTPKTGVSTAGATVFAWVWQNDQNETEGEGKRVEMTAYADGTWRCPLEEHGANYEVITVSEHGALCEVGYVDQRAPWFDDVPQQDNGGSGLSFVDNGNGTYTLKFRVRDDYETMKDGLTVDIGFNDAYSRENFTFAYNGRDIDWTANSGDPTGIYSVTAVKKIYPTTSRLTSHDYLDVTVQGVFANVTGTMDVTVTATDAYGNAGSAGTSQPVRYQAPAVTDHTMTSVTFSQPVRPVESWAWHEKDGDGFRTEWNGAFPISGNGTWNIQFRDAFGQIHGAEIETTDFTENGRDYSIDLGFSTTDFTGDPVILTTNAANGTIKVYAVDGTNYTTMTPVDGSPNTGTQKRQTKITRNMETQVELKDGGYTILRLRVYIDNIVTGAPAADVRYYVEQLGQEFTAAELAAFVGSGLTVTGSVRAWYNTDRRVIPTGDTGSEFVFTPGGQRSHTFTYVDDLGNIGSAGAALPAGLTLAGYVEPPEDTAAPDMSVDVYLRRGGVYTRAESFLGTDDPAKIAAKLDALGYVQGYSLTINASDESGFDLAATGGTLTGNVLTVTAAGEVTITVTDRSKRHNFTTVTFTVPAKIDNTKPTVIHEGMSNNGLYEKLLTLVFADRDDSGRDTVNGAENTVFPVLPGGIAAESGEKNRFTCKVTENGTIHVIFRDMAGNVWEKDYEVKGIDADPPTLTVRWSPSDELDDRNPPAGPINTNVTAHIDSDKAIQNLTVRAGNETTEHPLLTNGISTGYTINGQDGKPLVTITATSGRVTVTFSGNYDQTLIFTATAPNGKSREVDLRCYTEIDKEKPQITEQQHPMTRTGFSAPYAFWVWLTPNETVTSSNYGGWTSYELPDGTVERLPDEYTDSRPLRLTFTANGIYNVRFADEAGNVTIHTVTIAGIDRTAPVLTLGEPTISGKTATVEVTVNEPCTVTWGESGTYTFDAAGSHTITFTQNGTFAVTATDAAGNESFRMVTVGSIDDIAPTITFTSGTVYVKAGITAAELDAELAKGYEVRDNVTPQDALMVRIDASAVALAAAGQYTVTYTVEDAAGNEAKATRIVRVIGADTVCLNIDGGLVMPDSTAVLRRGRHRLTLENNGTEPFTVKARAGILSAGQMKYLSGSSLTFDADGYFNVTTPGYYTLLVTTQSRQTIRILLYVER